MEEKNPMADPVRNDEPLSSMRWPKSPSGTIAPIPTSARVSGEVALLPEDTPSRPLGEWPYNDRTEAAIPSDNRLQTAGEAVGAALGTVVSEAGRIPERIQEGVEGLKRRFRVITGGAGAEELKDRAAELTDEAQQRISEYATDASREARHWEFRARLYAIRYPLKFVAGAAAAGFAIGFLLRLWRDE